MPISVDVGVFNTPTSTGNSAVTGVGFEPELVIFICDIATVANRDTLQGFSIPSIGATDGTNEWMTSCNWSASVSSGYKSFRDDACLGSVNTSSGYYLRASIVSLDADGFTLNWSDVLGSARTCMYLAIAGLTNVHVGNFTANTSTGTKSITGVGFEPDSVLFGHTISTVKNSASLANTFFGLGASDGSNDCSVFCSTDSNGATSRKLSSSTYSLSTVAGNIVTHEASVDSLDADGFTLDTDTTNGSAYYHGYIAIRGASVGIVQHDSPASTGEQSIGGMTVDPEVIIHCTAGTTGEDAHETECISSVNFQTATNTMGAAHYDDDGATAGSSHSRTNVTNDYLLDVFQDPSNVFTQLETVERVTLDSAGFTGDWTVAAAGTRKHYAIGIGDPAAAPAAGPDGWWWKDD